jgi:hypothetical protein
VSALKRSAPGREIQGGASDVKRVAATVGHPVRLPNRQTSATAEAGTKKGQFYKPLPKEFRRIGFRYRQVARQGNAAIYEQTWSGSGNPSVCYDVIRIRRRDGFHIGGKSVPPAEVYPKSEAWGTHGFTFTDKDTAFAKLRELA